MDTGTIRTAILSLAVLGGVAIICIALIIVTLDDPDVAALAVLASIASAAVGGVAGMVSPSVRGEMPPSGDQAASRPSAQTKPPAGQSQQPGAPA